MYSYLRLRPWIKGQMARLHAKWNLLHGNNLNGLYKGNVIVSDEPIFKLLKKWQKDENFNRSIKAVTLKYRIK